MTAKRAVAVRPPKADTLAHFSLSALQPLSLTFLLDAQVRAIISLKQMHVPELLLNEEE
jgi:hypothetical protein